MSAFSPPVQPATLAQHQSSFSTLSLPLVLEDLSARFIVNLPEEELESMDRVCFQIEQAHWYYEDFIRPSASQPSLLPSYGLKAFSLLMFKSCPLLHDLVPSHGQIWTSFMAYKERVPVCGAVIINEYWDKVLLVKGWNKGASWSFPRGKINKDEPEAMCAVREVLEETGFDLTPFFPASQLYPSPSALRPSAEEEASMERNPYYVELVIREQKIRLYFVPGVREGTRFETRTRKEISKIDWFSLSSLPTWNQSNAASASTSHAAARSGKASAARSKGALENGKQAKYYMVTPFISHLKLWIDRNKPKNLPPRSSPFASSSSHLPGRKHQPVYETTSPRPSFPPTPQTTSASLSLARRGREMDVTGMPGMRMHALVPWSDEAGEPEQFASAPDQEDGTNHLPSETDLGGTSTEDEEESSEDEIVIEKGGGMGGGGRTWETAQQGTEALQALFFGSSPSASFQPQPILPSQPSSSLPRPALSSLQPPAPPSISSSPSPATLAATATPPQVAYERQQSFLQPRAQQSRERMGQQARLLELLCGIAGGGEAEAGEVGGLSSPPPLALDSAAGQGGSGGPGEGSLLGLLNGMSLNASGGGGGGSGHASVSPQPPGSYPTAQQQQHYYQQQQQQQQALLFGAPPSLPSASHPSSLHHAFAPSSFLSSDPSIPEPEPEPESYASLAEEEKREKHNALLRALFSVPAKPVPPPLLETSEAEGTEGGTPRSHRSEEIEALFGTSGSSRGGATTAGGSASDGRRRTGGQGGVWQALESEEDELGSPAVASVNVSGRGTGKGSLLAILNHQQQAAPPPLPQDAPVEAVAGVKDPLELLREYRSRQNGQEVPPLPPVTQVEPVVQQQQQAYYSPPAPLPTLPPAPPAVVQPSQQQQQLYHPQPLAPPPAASPQQTYQLSPGYPAAPTLPLPQQYSAAFPPQPSFPPTSSFPPAQPVANYPFPPQQQQSYLPPVSASYGTYAPPPPPQQHQQHFPLRPAPSSFPPSLHPSSFPPQQQQPQQGFYPQQQHLPPVPPVISYGASTGGGAPRAVGGAGGGAGTLLGLLNAKG
ncbi:hypothetical protein JCM8547_000038 [Rhodosporidiobolus lusitaniae]